MWLEMSEWENKEVRAAEGGVILYIIPGLGKHITLSVIENLGREMTLFDLNFERTTLVWIMDFVILEKKQE